MSFKREGNDSGYLATVRKRRIEELFSFDIPEDEALLMKNGRFTCLVCSHRPIFDTVNMLAVHRQGKKHLANLPFHESKKKEIEDLIEKRRHHNYMKTGCTGVKTTPDSSGESFLKRTPYDPRTKKTTPNPHDRKQCLHLDTSDDLSTSERSQIFLSNDKKDKAVLNLQSSKHNRLAAIRKELKKPIQHIMPINNLPTNFKPYQSKRRKIEGTTEEQSHREAQFTSSQTFAETQCSTQVLSTSNLTLTTVPKIPKQTQLGNLERKPSTNNNTLSAKSSLLLASGTKQHVLKQHVLNRKKAGHSLSKSLAIDQTTLIGSKLQDVSTSEEKTKSRELYMQAWSSGWKKNKDGQWIQDEDVEFDSDEEPPQIP